MIAKRSTQLNRHSKGDIVSDEVIDPQTQTEIVTFFSRHLIGLAWWETKVDAGGKHVVEPEFNGASGFLVELGGYHFLVTAGHIFKDYESRSQAGIEFLQPSIFDIWGPEATEPHRIPFDFFDSQHPKVFEFSEKDGFDFALIVVPELILKALTQTTIPFRRDDWECQDWQSFSDYVLLGLPRQFSMVQKGGSGASSWKKGEQRPALLWLRKLNGKEFGIADTTFPQFVGEVSGALGLDSIVGMSGGIIIGMRENESGQLIYYPVAIQSRWLKKQRITIGCLTQVAANFTDAIVKKLTGVDLRDGK